MANVRLGFNGTVRLLAVPGAAFVNVVLSTAGVRRVVLKESPVTAVGAANTSVGFLVKVPNDGAGGFVTEFGRPPISADGGDWPEFSYGSPFDFGDKGVIIGPYDGATALLQVASMSGAATVLEVWEFA